MGIDARVQKAVLDNGLTILTHTVESIPNVSCQIWYNVGSKHEQTGQKGIAHLLEHMIFKGTKKLSESDINVITTKLSGTCNAFTSYDYTGYLFDFPLQHWHHALELFADCMYNCAFKQEHFNSELGAVLQELKMYRDNYDSNSVEELLKTIFVGHPYESPIIGNKRDLNAITPDTLREFYRTHYTPNNATLVVVGPVSHETVLKQAEKYFTVPLTGAPRYTGPRCGPALPAVALTSYGGHGGVNGSTSESKTENTLTKTNIPIPREFCSKNVTLVRDIQQPILTCAFTCAPGAQKEDYALEIITWLMGSGKTSRLYQDLVVKHRIATDVDMAVDDLFEQSILMINIQPKNTHVIPEIIARTKACFELAIKKGFSTPEFERARAKVKTDFVSLFEYNQKVAYAIGKTYLATGDENYLNTYLDQTTKETAREVQKLFEQYLQPEFMHTSAVLPIQDEVKKLWLTQQEQEDKKDQLLQEQKKRVAPVEQAVFADKISVKEPTPFIAPQAREFTLSNGLEILAHSDPKTPKVEILLEFKADNLYEPTKQAGIAHLTSQAITHGTKKLGATAFNDYLESRGMKLASWPGFVSLSMLSEHVQDGLTILADMLMNAALASKEIELVRAQVFADIAQYWDEPYQFCSAIVRKEIYGTHPYGKQELGTKASVQKITTEQIRSYFKEYFSPQGARLAIAGDLSKVNIEKVLEKTLGKWGGPLVEDLDFPTIKPVKAHTIDERFNRDQVVLAYAGLSIPRIHPDYDKLLLFDQIFGGGVLGAMSSYLFAIREQTGLFYTIRGSVLAHASKQPGLSLVKTIVSLDRLSQAERAIQECIKTAPERITEEELIQAKNAITNAMPNNFQTYRQMASTFLYLKRFGLPANYFDDRAAQLQKVKRKDVQEAAAKVLERDKMVCVRIGRV